MKCNILTLRRPNSNFKVLLFLALFFSNLFLIFEVNAVDLSTLRRIKEGSQITISDLKTNPLDGIKISGNVQDVDGANIIGATVMCEGTTIGSITDANGNYSIVVPDDADYLIFSFVGMKTRKEPINKNNIINVILEPDAYDLDEVIAIGYGYTKKSDLTGSLVSIKADDLYTGGTEMLDAAIAGKVAGVQVTQMSGVPGSGATIRIRGTNSILGTNEPLYVVDGVPFSGGAGAGGLDIGEGAGISGLSHVNPSDIESIEILKDASSTAIYGSRGANGVILITTKRGNSSSKSTLNYGSYFGLQQIAHKIDLTNSKEYGELMNEYHDYIGQPIQYTNLDSLGNGTDWQNELYRTGFTQNHYLSMSGGDKKTQYMVSLNFLDQEGIVINSFFDRYSLRANIDSKLNDRLRVGNSLALVRTTGNITSSADPNNKDIISGVLTARPTFPVKVGEAYSIYVDDDNNIGNPIARALDIINYDIRNRIYGNFYLDLEILKNLNFRSTLGYDLTSSKANYYAPITVAAGADRNGWAKIGTRSSVYWNSTNILSYDKEFNSNHHLTLMGGVTWEHDYEETTRIEAQDFVTDALLFHDVSSAALQQAFSNASDWSLHSYIGRANYSLFEKYLITLTGRLDGSSRFGEDHKYGFFPSMAVAWRVKQESFLSNVDWLSNLKLRISAGTAGEQSIPSYNSLASLSSVSLNMGNEILVGFYPSQMANFGLRWESTSQANLGIDLGIIQNRISFSIDAYYKVTNDLLYEIEVPKITGYSTALLNIGQINNKGIEFLTNVVAVDKKFKWDFSINLAANRNKVLALNDELTEIIAPPNSATSSDLKSNPSIIKVGYPIGSLYGYVFDGIFQNQDEVDAIIQTSAGIGEIRIKDLDGDGEITPKDKTIIGDVTPNFIGGIINNFSFGKLRLKTNFQWSVGNDIFSFQTLYNTNANSKRNFTKDFYDNRWTEAIPNNHTPRSGYNPRVYPDNSWFVFDGSYLRCKNITLSYSFKFKNFNIVDKAKIYISADNLFTLTKYPGYNPDVSAFGTRNLAQGIDIGVYPVARTILLGFDFQF